MSDMDDEYFANVHVRDHALEKAIIMVRSGVIKVEDHLKWAKHYWDFLHTGTIPLPAEMMIPDDLSSLVEPEEVIHEADVDPLPLDGPPPWEPTDYPYYQPEEPN